MTTSPKGVTSEEMLGDHRKSNRRYRANMTDEKRAALAKRTSDQRRKNPGTCALCGAEVYRGNARCRRCAAKGNHRKRGIPNSPETRKNISLANRGRTMSPEWRKKIGDAQRGDRNRFWRGGRYVNKEGYVLVYQPSHPYATIQGYVLEHRLVMEAHLGRTLLPSEVVHHIDGNSTNNATENLMLFSTNGDHTKYHAQIRSSKHER